MSVLFHIDWVRACFLPCPKWEYDSIHFVQVRIQMGKVGRLYYLQHDTPPDGQMPNENVLLEREMASLTILSKAGSGRHVFLAMFIDLKPTVNVKSTRGSDLWFSSTDHTLSLSLSSTTVWASMSKLFVVGSWLPFTWLRWHEYSLSVLPPVVLIAAEEML